MEGAYDSPPQIKGDDAVWQTKLEYFRKARYADKVQYQWIALMWIVGFLAVILLGYTFTSCTKAFASYM